MAKDFRLSKLLMILFSLSLFLFIFSFAYNLPVDLDFGWHLRNAQKTIAERQIPTSDSFSHTFKGKQLLSAAWLSELFFYFLFSHFSFFGLSLIVGFLTALAVFLVVYVWDLPESIQFLLVVWLSLGCLTIFKVGPRTQNFSWLFFAILIFLLFRYLKSRRKKLLFPIPFVFLFWANFHPGFWLGLSLIVFLVFFELAELFLKRENSRLNKERTLSLIVIFLLSLGATFFRPTSQSGGGSFFGLVKGLMLPLNLATEFSETGAVRMTIAEWLPPAFFVPSTSLLLLAIVFSIAIFACRPVKFTQVRNLGLLFFFAYFSTLARRNAPFFFLVFAPVVGKELKKFSFWRKTESLKPIIQILIVVLLLLIAIPRIKSTTVKIKRAERDFAYYCEQVGYPYQALQYIKDHPLPAKVFNIYNWGGFLIWQLPEYPTFVDGRVPASEIFKEYQKVINLEPGWEEILEKYQVGWVLVKPSFLFEQILITSGDWEEAYGDEMATILVKKEFMNK